MSAFVAICSTLILQILTIAPIGPTSSHAVGHDTFSVIVALRTALTLRRFAMDLRTVWMDRMNSLAVTIPVKPATCLASPMKF